MEKMKVSEILKNAAGKAAYGLVWLGTAVTVGEITENGLHEVKHFCKDVKQVMDPEPVLVKKGLFGKKKAIWYNPFTEKWSDYTGTKKPANKKPYKI